MRQQQGKRRFLFLYMLGFFCGVLYANFAARNYVTMSTVFHSYFLDQYVQDRIVSPEYLWYLARCRLIPFGLVALSARTRLKKLTAAAVLLWTGFSCGVLAVTAVLRMGAAGILLCLTGLLPQFLFYVPGYLVLLWYLDHYPDSRWTAGKTIFTAVMLLAGLLSEAYLNPWLVGAFLKIVR